MDIKKDIAKSFGYGLAIGFIIRLLLYIKNERR